MNRNLPQVFIFACNESPSFDVINDGVAWKVLKDIGRESLSKFRYRSSYCIRASWDNGENYTATLQAEIGFQYLVKKNNTGYVLEKNGLSTDQGAIEILNNINVKGGILAQLCNDGRVIMGKKIVAYNQQASFRPSEKIYWGLASEINEGKGIKSAVLNSKNFFEVNLKGLSDIWVSLNGNAKNGYYFQIEKQS